MKRNLFIGIVLIGIVIGGLVLKTEKIVYTAPEVITEEVKIDALEALVEEAIQASSTETHNMAQEAYSATVERLNREIRLNVLQEQNELLKEEIEGLEKDLGTY